MLLHLDERERFALGVGYGSFQSTLNEIRDRVARIQEALDRDTAKQSSLDELSKKLDTLARLRDVSVHGAPLELAQEAKQRLEAAELSTRLLQVLQVVKQRQMTTPADLATELRLKPNTCSQYLNELADRGYIKKVAYGVYGPDSK